MTCQMCEERQAVANLPECGPCAETQCQVFAEMDLDRALDVLGPEAVLQRLRTRCAEQIGEGYTDRETLLRAVVDNLDSVLGMAAWREAR